MTKIMVKTADGKFIDMEKGKEPIGAVATWADGKQYRKVSEGHWEPDKSEKSHNAKLGGGTHGHGNDDVSTATKLHDRFMNYLQNMSKEHRDIFRGGSFSFEKKTFTAIGGKVALHWNEKNNRVDIVKTEDMEKARVTKYIKRLPHPSGKGYIYFYTREQVAEYKKSGKIPEQKDHKETGGVMHGIMNFFGLFNDNQVKAIVKQEFDKHGDKFKGVDEKSFADHLNEYFLNKEKWDAKILGKPAGGGGEKKPSAPKEPKATGGEKKSGGSKFNLSIMKTIAGIYGVKKEDKKPYVDDRLEAEEARKVAEEAGYNPDKLGEPLKKKEDKKTPAQKEMEKPVKYAEFSIYDKQNKITRTYKDVIVVDKKDGAGDRCTYIYQDISDMAKERPLKKWVNGSFDLRTAYVADDVDDKTSGKSEDNFDSRKEITPEQKKYQDSMIDEMNENFKDPKHNKDEGIDGYKYETLVKQYKNFIDDKSPELNKNGIKDFADFPAYLKKNAEKDEKPSATEALKEELKKKETGKLIDDDEAPAGSTVKDIFKHFTPKSQSAYIKQASKLENRLGDIVRSKEFEDIGAWSNGNLMVSDPEFSSKIYETMKKGNVNTSEGKLNSTAESMVDQIMKPAINHSQKKPAEILGHLPADKSSENGSEKLDRIVLQKEDGEQCAINADLVNFFETQYKGKNITYHPQEGHQTSVLVKVNDKPVGVVMPMSLPKAGHKYSENSKFIKAGTAPAEKPAPTEKKASVIPNVPLPENELTKMYPSISKYVKMIRNTYKEEIEKAVEKGVSEEEIRKAIEKSDAQSLNYAAKLRGQIENKDFDKLSEVLHTGNKNSRMMFEEMTGVKLGTTNASTKTALEKYCGKGNPLQQSRSAVLPSEEADKSAEKQKKMKAELAPHKSMLSKLEKDSHSYYNSASQRQDLQRRIIETKAEIEKIEKKYNPEPLTKATQILKEELLLKASAGGEGGNHKYIRRIPAQGGKGYIYFYTPEQIKEYQEKGTIPKQESGKHDEHDLKKEGSDPKQVLKTALKKIGSILADALSAKDAVAPTGQAVEESGEKINDKAKEKKRLEKQRDITKDKKKNSDQKKPEEKPKQK